METISKIRRKYFVNGISIKQISQDLRLSRNTVRKVIRRGKTEHQYHRNNQPAPLAWEVYRSASATFKRR